MPPSKKHASGLGTIQRITKKSKGKTYVYYKARYQYIDAATKKQVTRSIIGRDRKEVAQKLRAVLEDLDTEIHNSLTKMTVEEWLAIWADQYLGNVKESTVATYKSNIRTHINPRIGMIRIVDLNTHAIQQFYNSMRQPTEAREALSPKSVKNIHGILHRALQQAVANGYININPTDSCVLPRITKKELKPLDETETRLFLKVIKGHTYESLYTFTLFTGMREGEVLGLTWDNIDFLRGTIMINKQLQKEKKAGGKYRLVSLKNDSPRRITPAPWVLQLLENQALQQKKEKDIAGSAWENPMNLVFTNKNGRHLIPQTVVRHFKDIVTSIGRPDARFHDLRHSYAVASLMAGDDIKTVQGNLGHATASFTLDVYGHVTDQMQKASAERMEAYIQRVLDT